VPAHRIEDRPPIERARLLEVRSLQSAVPVASRTYPLLPHRKFLLDDKIKAS
jgi:hypothetical protein